MSTTILCSWRNACSCFAICLAVSLCLIAVWWVIRMTIVQWFFCERSICPVREHCEAEEVGFWSYDMCGCYEDVWARPEKVVVSTTLSSYLEHDTPPFPSSRDQYTGIDEKKRIAAILVTTS